MTATPGLIRAQEVGAENPSRLFGDEDLITIRGQLVVLLPQPELNYCTIGPSGVYMFPRHDGVLLGGSFDRGVASGGSHGYCQGYATHCGRIINAISDHSHRSITPDKILHRLHPFQQDLWECDFT